jgi:hypothetical protein
MAGHQESDGCVGYRHDPFISGPGGERRQPVVCFMFVTEMEKYVDCPALMYLGCIPSNQHIDNDK